MRTSSLPVLGAREQMWALRRSPASQRRAAAYLRLVVIATFACTRGCGDELHVRYPHAALVMTPRRLAPPAARRALSLRVTLLAVALVAGLYAGALPGYLYFRISRPALALGAVTEAVADAAEILAHRDGALDHAGALVRRLARSPTLPADSGNAAQRPLDVREPPPPIQPDGQIPPAFRAPLTPTH